MRNDPEPQDVSMTRRFSISSGFLRETELLPNLSNARGVAQIFFTARPAEPNRPAATRRRPLQHRYNLVD